MRKIAFVLAAAAFLGGCSHQVHRLDLISRDNTGNGSGNAQEEGKQITISLNGKTYMGTYIYDGRKTIGAIRSETATAYSGSSNATAYGTGYSSAYIPGSGNGKILATSGNDSLRCDFNYSDGSGIGYCQDSAGKKYDLLIH